MSSTQQFSCLYTKHKTQKRRVWHDGRLVVSGGRARLFSAQPTSADPPLDECDFSESKPMETEKFLIQIEGPWVKPTTAFTGPGPSTNLPKVLGRKFQPPQRIIPPLHRSNRTDMILGKRKRPLQPGELEQLHYGSNAARLDPSSRSFSSNAGSLQGTAQSLPDAWQSRTTFTRVHHHGTGVVHSLQPPPPQQQQQQQQHNSTPLVPSGTDSSLSTDQASHRHPSRMTTSCHARLSTIPNEGFHAQEEAGPSQAQPDRSRCAATRTGPAITAPDAFVLQPTKTNQQPRLGNLPFVSNNFNEREYYGFEEEEEEDNDGTEDQENTNDTNLDQRPIHGLCHQFSTRPRGNTPPAQNQNPILAPGAVPDPFPVPAPTVKPKTTSDLFALFGTVPLIPPSSPRQEPTSTGSTSHPTIQSVDKDKPCMSPHQEIEQLQFYLPSPTNSEESDQD